MANGEVVDSVSFESSIVGADIRVDYTEEGVEVKESRDNDFGRPVDVAEEDRFLHAVDLAADILASFIDGDFKLVADEEWNCIAFEVTVQDRDDAGCLLGRNMEHLNTFFKIFRKQQIYPHSKIIKFTLKKQGEPESESDEFWNQSSDEIKIIKVDSDSESQNRDVSRDRQSEKQSESEEVNNASSGRRGVSPPR